MKHGLKNEIKRGLSVLLAASMVATSALPVLAEDIDEIVEIEAVADDEIIEEAAEDVAEDVVVEVAAEEDVEEVVVEDAAFIVEEPETVDSTTPASATCDHIMAGFEFMSEQIVVSDSGKDAKAVAKIYYKCKECGLVMHRTISDEAGSNWTPDAERPFSLSYVLLRKDTPNDCHVDGEIEWDLYLVDNSERASVAIDDYWLPKRVDQKFEKVDAEHQLIDPNVIVKQIPTCTEDGYGITICHKCGDTLDHYVLDELGHAYMVKPGSAKWNDDLTKVTVDVICMTNPEHKVPRLDVSKFNTVTVYDKEGNVLTRPLTCRDEDGTRRAVLNIPAVSVTDTKTKRAENLYIVNAFTATSESIKEKAPAHVFWKDSIKITWTDPDGKVLKNMEFLSDSVDKPIAVIEGVCKNEFDKWNKNEGGHKYETIKMPCDVDKVDEYMGDCTKLHTRTWKATAKENSVLYYTTEDEYLVTRGNRSNEVKDIHSYTEAWSKGDTSIAVHTIKPATCTETGKACYYCEWCKKNFTVDVPMKPHDFKQVSEKVDAGCHFDAHYDGECTVCGAKRAVDVPKSYGHIVEGTIEFVPPTSTTPGWFTDEAVATFECKQNGKTNDHDELSAFCEFADSVKGIGEEVTKKSPRVVTKDATVTLVEYVPATCEKEGYRKFKAVATIEYVDKLFDNSLAVVDKKTETRTVETTQEFPIPKLTHTYGDYEAHWTKDMSCTFEATCDNCGATKPLATKVTSEDKGETILYTATAKYSFVNEFGKVETKTLESTKEVKKEVPKTESYVKLPATIAFDYTANSHNLVATSNRAAKEIHYDYYKENGEKISAGPIEAGKYYCYASVAANDTFTAAKSAKCTIVINKIANNAKVKPATKTLKKGKKFTIKVSQVNPRYEANTAVKFSVSGKSAKNLTVSKKGVVKAKKTAKAGTYKVKVTIPASSNLNPFETYVTVKVK